MVERKKKETPVFRQFDATRTTFTHKINVIFWNPKGGTFLPKNRASGHPIYLLPVSDI
jgi:hypothetical protein